MLIIKKINLMSTGIVRYAVQSAVTGVTVPSLTGPGKAHYKTKEEAEANLEAHIQQQERMTF